MTEYSVKEAAAANWERHDKTYRPNLKRPSYEGQEYGNIKNVDMAAIQKSLFGKTDKGEN